MNAEREGQVFLRRSPVIDPGLAKEGIMSGKTNICVYSCKKINGCSVLKEEMGVSALQ